MVSRLTALLAAGIGAVAMGASTAWAGPATIDVPEPTSLALLAVGLGGAAWIKFRSRK